MWVSIGQHVHSMQGTMKVHIQPNVQQVRALNNTEPAQAHICVNY